ncbi:Peptidase family M48 [Soonwooa buanensis]|uniref:Peptidase family M48 n=1 Tax=Soonwooa buanensis TaxID=619805 RepID=A0A1T5FW26_9FLAO|nr:M48 family metalloprotease [Soonwooa buanensis]SKC00297.1 Peptidase family M48 [Soonwooa buanensis]
MKKLYIIVFLLLLKLFSAQNFKIDTADYAKRKAFLELYKTRGEQFNKALKKKYSGQEARELVNVFTNFQKSVTEDIKDKMYSFDDRFVSYTKDRVNYIASKNPTIPTDFSILIAKDNEPNAYNFGDKTLVVNLGLFAFLNNEFEFDAIISHELAHQTLEHTIKKLIAKLNNDKDKKLEVSNLKRSGNRYDKAFELYKSLLYSNMKQRRKNEISADSLGFSYYKTTGLPIANYVQSLQLLKDFDDKKEDSIDVSIYKKVFNIPTQSFKEDWLKMEDFSKYNYKHYQEKVSQDSLKTHPDLEFRINLLKKNYPELATSNLNSQASPQFSLLSNLAKERLIPNFIESEKYGQGIYNCLAILEDNPDHKATKYYLGLLFNKIYDARKTYTLNRYLDKIEPTKQSRSYQQFLSFMWNLGVDEIKNIGQYYEKSEN